MSYIYKFVKHHDYTTLSHTEMSNAITPDCVITIQSSNLEVFPFYPALTLPIKQVMLLSTKPIPFRNAFLSPMSRHVEHDLYAHRLLLTIGQIAISTRKLLEFLFVQCWNLVRIDRDQFVLLMAHPRSAGCYEQIVRRTESDQARRLTFSYQ